MAGYSNTGQFDLARKRAEQRANTEQQQQDDALKRRFTAMGNLNSGAYVKQQSVQADEASKRKADVMEGIDVAEAGEAQRQREVLEGRQFQTSERLGSQDFANLQRLGSQDFGASQAQLQRMFATGERLGSQEFAAGENALGRRFATSEREASQGFQSSERMGSQDFANQQRLGSQDFQAGQNQASRDQQASQFNRQMQLEEAAQIFNMQMAEWEKDQANRGIVGSLLGSGGVFGVLGELFGS